MIELTEARDAVLAIFPNASFDFDNNGQVVFYTNCQVKQDLGKKYLVDMEDSTNADR